TDVEGERGGLGGGVLTTEIAATVVTHLVFEARHAVVILRRLECKPAAGDVLGGDEQPAAFHLRQRHDAAVHDQVPVLAWRYRGDQHASQVIAFHIHKREVAGGEDVGLVFLAGHHPRRIGLEIEGGRVVDRVEHHGDGAEL